MPGAFITGKKGARVVIEMILRRFPLLKKGAAEVWFTDEAGCHQDPRVKAAVESTGRHFLLGHGGFTAGTTC